MSYLLYNWRTGKVVIGETRREAVQQVITIDHARRCAIVDGDVDTVTIGPDYATHDEFVREVCNRGLVMLSRRGWALFSQVSM